MAPLVLYIDDAPQLPAGFLEALRAEGYELEQTGDPEAAIGILDQRAPALILMEVQLGSCDGLDLLEGIRHHKPDVPVVVLTRSERDPGIYGEVVAQGVRDFLSQPIRTPDLLASIRRFAPPEPDPEPKDMDVAQEAAPGAGALAELPLPEVLRELHEHGANGALIASSGEARIGVLIRNGSPVALTSNREPEALEDFLLRSGSIDARQLRRITLRMTAEDETAAEAIVALELLSGDGLQAAICRRAEEQLFEALAWTEGAFRFHEGRRLKSDVALEREPARIVLDGVLEALPQERARDRLRKRGDVYVSCRDEKDLAGLALTHTQHEAVARLDGARSLVELMEIGEFDERLLYGLWVTGALDLHAAPVLTLTDELGDAVVAEEAVEDVAQQEASRALEAERSFRQGEGYLKAKRYDKAIEAFGMASHLDPNAGEYRAHLGYAMYLANPDVKVVQKEAMEHVATGIKLSPTRDTSYVFLGRILRLTGDLPTAYKIFRKALKINPACHAASQELRLLKSRAQKENGGPKGLLSRLLKR